MKRFLSSLFLLSCLSISLEAQDAKAARFLMAGALEFGGDEVAEVIFIDGSSQSVNAGQGGSLFVGGQFQIPTVKPLLFRASVGFKYVTTKAENANIRMTRVPLHFTTHYLITEDIHIGGGLAMHQGINFKADGIGDDVKFDAASGPRIEVGWKAIALT